ncbi:MAG: 4Fe-4S dicluster domain-containing protein [Nitrospiraceae bacterium]|nr:4Fe-4S dicluster domain-containing protein [Nitrospiraceae bacterium]
MGHAANPDVEYRRLQQRYDRNVTGAPYSPTFIKILELLFTPEEAALARRIPGSPTSLRQLSAKLGIPPDELDPQLTAMAQRGVVLDLTFGGKRYFVLPPVVVGFFEFAFMRVREDIDQAELARLFETYMFEEDRFCSSVFQKQTSIGRTFVHETALPEGDHTEILDWERASSLIENATAVAVGLCACRHKAEHLGHPCEIEVENCLSLNSGATSMVHAGNAKTITNAEGMRILEKAREDGLVQTGDNVKNDMSFMCNCCGCCCGFMRAIKTFDLKTAAVTSNWIAGVDHERCRGCTLCEKACPIDAIAMVEVQGDGEEKRKKAVVDESVCLGCGVCYGSCKFDAIGMRSRERRVFTPEDVFDRVVNMAIERGKLSGLLFENPEQLHHRALARVISILEKSPPWKAAMAIKPLKSAFLNRLIEKARP